MMAIWWQWFLGAFVLLSLACLYVAFIFLIAWLKSMRISPKFEGIWYSDDGKIKEKRVISDNTSLLSSSEWQLKSSNPNKVRFKITARGIGKPEEREWDADDFLEMNYESGDKKLILFGLSGFDARFAIEKKMYGKVINGLSADNANNKSKYLELKRDFNEAVKEYVTTSKSLIAFQPPSKKKKES